MLKETIKSDLIKAIKEKNEIVFGTLRMVLSSISNREKEKRYKIAKEGKDLPEEELVKKSNLTEEELIEVVFSEAKKRKEAILEYEKGGRKDLADKEKAEAEVLKKYLPEQLSEEEIKKLVQEAIAAQSRALGEPRSVLTEREKVGPKDIGKIMAELMPKVKGRADGSEISRIVKKFLSPQDND